MSVTKLANLVDPEVMSGLIQQKMTDLLRFSPLATVDATLAGRPGDTLTLPKYAYIGDAGDVAEGEAIPIAQLTATTVTAKVKKAAKGVEITDEAVMAGFGDPLGESASQLGTAIAQKVDNDCLAALQTLPAARTCDASSAILSSAVIADALVKFCEDVDDVKALLIAPAQLAQLRKDPDYISRGQMGEDILMKGTVGEIWGCQIVVSNKITAKSGKFTNYIVKPGALAIYLKRDMLVETDRDIARKTTIVTADQHYTAYLLDESRAVKLIVKETAGA